MKRGRRPSVTSMVLQGNIVNHVSISTVLLSDLWGGGCEERTSVQQYW